MDKNLCKKVNRRMIGVKEKCDYGHSKCQLCQHTFTGLCHYALHTLWLYITAKRFGAKILWEKNHKLLVSCPNPNDFVIFELSADEH